jgi:hypothetical protein
MIVYFNLYQTLPEGAEENNENILGDPSLLTWIKTRNFGV